MNSHSPAQAAAAVVVGGGTMGAGVAVVLARGGVAVTVVETDAARRDRLLEQISAELAAAGMAGRAQPLRVCAGLADVAWAGVVLVVECITEQLAAKQALFAQLLAHAPADAVLASNSSGLPISAIAAGLPGGERMLGLHFFMPAQLVPLVEVVLGERSDAGRGRWLCGLMRACGSVPVLVRKDRPGFLANRMQHALAREAFALIDEGVASAEDVDAAVRFGFGFRFLAAGPVLQRDHAGIEVHCAAAATIYPSLCNGTEPARALRERVAQGHLGLKTGKGFFDWPEERQQAERARYEGLLRQGLALLAGERQETASAPPAGSASDSDSAHPWRDQPLIVTVAPNGAYKQSRDHAALPITADALAATARACLDAGAAMLHLHIRDAQGRHSLDAQAYREALRIVRRAVGQAMVIQVTSEAAGVYRAAEQIAMVQDLAPEALSVGLREIDQPEIGEAGLQRFFAALARQRCMTQIIVYDLADLRRWQDLRARGVAPDAPWWLLFVLGRYSAGQQSRPGDLLPFVGAHQGSEPWAVCAFGATENSCIAAAAALGGHARVGFENNLLCKDGSPAPDNAALVRQAVQVAQALGRPLASADDIRQRLGAR